MSKTAYLRLFYPQICNFAILLFKIVSMYTIIHSNNVCSKLCLRVKTRLSTPRSQLFYKNCFYVYNSIIYGIFILGQSNFSSPGQKVFPLPL